MDMLAKNLIDEELIERLVDITDEAIRRLRFHAEYGDGERALKLARELEPILHNGLIDVHRWERLAEGQSAWRQKTEDRLISALEEGTDEALLEFLEWYYGHWYGWPVHDSLARELKSKSRDEIKQTLKQLYVQALRHLAVLDCATLNVFLYDEKEGTYTLRNDLREEAMHAWGQQINWLMTQVPLAASLIATFGEDELPSFLNIAIKQTPQGYEPFVINHSSPAALLITRSEDQ